MGWKDVAHGFLNVAGFIPGVGAIADVANGALYLSEGKYLEAGISFVAAVPGIGDSVALVSKGAKAAKGLKGLSAAEKGLSMAKGLKGAGKSALESGKEIAKLGKGLCSALKSGEGILKASSMFASSIPVVGDIFKLGKGLLSGLAKGAKSLKGLSLLQILSLLKGKGMNALGKVMDGARSLKGMSRKQRFEAIKNKCKEYFLTSKYFEEIDAPKGNSGTDIGYMKNNADPMRDALGSGRISNPDEWNSILKQLEDRGVEIKFRDGNMAYAPGLADGNPGQIVIDPDASISALKHEYQHFLDAKSEGFPSFGKQMFEDPKSRVIKELRAYMVEIKDADRYGLKDISEQLFENYRQEREWIVNKYILPGGD